MVNIQICFFSAVGLLSWGLWRCIFVVKSIPLGGGWWRFTPPGSIARNHRCIHFLNIPKDKHTSGLAVVIKSTIHKWYPQAISDSFVYDMLHDFDPQTGQHSSFCKRNLLTCHLKNFSKLVGLSLALLAWGWHYYCSLDHFKC